MKVYAAILLALVVTAGAALVLVITQPFDDKPVEVGSITVVGEYPGGQLQYAQDITDMIDSGKGAYDESGVFHVW